MHYFTADMKQLQKCCLPSFSFAGLPTSINTSNSLVGFSLKRKAVLAF